MFGLMCLHHDDDNLISWNHLNLQNNKQNMKLNDDHTLLALFSIAVAAQ